MGKQLSDAALTAEMVAMFGVTHTTTLIGWATLAWMFGADDARSFIERVPVGGISTRYKRLADLRALADSLRAKGYDLVEPDPVAAIRFVLVGNG
jgi:hypothetical protein